MSKNKKTRIAKRLGASALAVATLASGLSFGSAAVAASAATADPSSRTQIGSLVTQSGGGYALPFSAPGIASVGEKLPANRSASLEEARGKAITWRIPAEGAVASVSPLSAPKLCLTALTPTAGESSDVTLKSCDAADPAQRFRLAANDASNNPRGTGLQSTYNDGFLGLYNNDANMRLQGASTADRLELLDEFMQFNAEVSSVDIPGRSAVISGQASPGAYVVIEWGDGESDELRADAVTGEWAYNLEGLKLGKNPVSLKQYENQQQTGEYDLEVDLKVADLTVDHKFGENRDDLVMLSGKAEPGAVVQVFDGADKLVAASGVVSEVTGEWSLELPAPNASGAYDIAVYQSVQGERTSKQDVSIDYGRQLVITKPADGFVHAGGSMRMSGTGEPGSSIAVHKGKELVGSANVLQTGNWNLTTKDLNASEHRLSVTQKSKGGNTTVATITVNPGESDIAPLEIRTPADGSTVESGSNRVEFSGVGEPGARVEVKTQGANSRTIVNTIVREDGTWSQLGANLAFDVDYVLDTIYTPQGEAAVNGTHRVTVKDANPGVTQPFAFTTPRNGSEVIAPNKQVRLAGTGTTGTTVNIWAYKDKARSIGTATVDKAGQWEIPAGAFNNQNTQYDMHVEYTAPGQAMQALTHTITVKAQAGIERPFDFTTPAAESTIIAPDHNVTFTGTGTTGTEIIIWNDKTKGRPVAKAVVDAKGNWVGVGQLNNQNGEYNLHVEYTEPGKQTASFDRHVFIKAEASTERPFEVATPAQDSTVTLNNSRTLVEGTGTTGGMVKVWNYNSKDRIVIEGRKVLTVDENGKWSGLGEFAAQPYDLHIEYFAPGVDTEGEPTQVITRHFTATAAK